MRGTLYAVNKCENAKRNRRYGVYISELDAGLLRSTSKGQTRTYVLSGARRTFVRMSQASTARKAHDSAKSTRRSGSSRRSGKVWSGADRMRLTALADRQIPAERIALKLGRTEAAVRAEAAKQRVMLAPASPPSRIAPQARPTQKRAYGGMTLAAGGTNRAGEPSNSPKLPKPKTPAASRNRSRPVQSETLF